MTLRRACGFVGGPEKRKSRPRNWTGQPPKFMTEQVMQGAYALCAYLTTHDYYCAMLFVRFAELLSVT
jgi:hypothetical protein